jgi:hypothetical protein
MNATVDAERASRDEIGAETTPNAPAPALSVFDATMITVGIVIGAGIFQTPTMVAGIAGTPTLMLPAACFRWSVRSRTRSSQRRIPALAATTHFFVGPMGGM